MNFINLNQEDPSLQPKINIKKINIQNTDDQEQSSIVINPYKVEVQIEEPKEGCIKENNVPRFECSTEYFAIKNLFSELTDDYQRAIIRQNLGIGNEGVTIWGKIEGNLANQKDLSNFITELLNRDQSKILDSVNLELKYWTQQIENKIESLASNIKSLEIIPRYGVSNELPVDILVTWEYENEVEAQAINGISLDTNVRSYIFQNVSDALSIRLAYLLDGTWLARNVNFEVSFPIFYGVSENPEDDSYTIKNKFTVNAGEDEYIYVITKNESDLSVNGIIGGFEYIGITYVSSIRYYIYRSVNTNLGETTIIINDK